LLGSRAAYVKWGLDPQEAKLREGRSPDTPGFGDDPESHWGLLGAEEELRPVPTETGAYRRFYEGVVDALRGVAPPPVDPHDAVAALAVIEAARRSAAERRVIAVPNDVTPI
jgi:predicted dehydrogenase